MKHVVCIPLACVALCLSLRAGAAAPTPSEIERSIFLSMLLDPDYDKSQLGARILGQEFPKDDAACDAIAERLLTEPAVPASGGAVRAITYYVVVLRDSCTGRYRDVLTLARQRFTHEKVVKYIDSALAMPADTAVAQYKQGGVDLLARQIELQQQLGDLRHAGGSARGAPVGATLGEVVERAGLPQDFTQLSYTIARYGHATTLVAHYRNAGMLIFRRDYTRNRWVLGEALDELASASESYQGSKFGVAQSVVCLRGAMFREYIKRHGREIRADAGVVEALANRLAKVPFPSDRFEEDGMLIGLKLIVTSRHPDKLRLMRQIGAAPGDDVPETARDYIKKLERNAPMPAAEPEPAEPVEAEEKI